MEKIQLQHATMGTDDKRIIGSIARWNAVIEKIKELERKAAAPLADLADVDVEACLETCRKLKEEIKVLQDSCIPHYDAIAQCVAEMEKNRTDVPKLIEERISLYAQIKDVVARLHNDQFEYDQAHFKAQHAQNEKRRAEALAKSQSIKARLEEMRKTQEARIEKAMNTLPHEREVAVATRLLSSLRSVALPGTCGTSETSAAPAAPKPKAQPTMTSAPAVELEEAVVTATTVVVSRKSQPIPKVGKKQNKKKAEKAAEPKTQEPKKKTKEDTVRIPPVAANYCEELSVSIPTTYGELEETYNLVKEKLEAFEKVRAMVREQRQKELQEAEQKAKEEAAKKDEERAKAKAESEKKAEEPAAEPSAAEEPAPAEPAAAEPAAAEPAAAEPTAEEPAPESQ